VTEAQGTLLIQKVEGVFALLQYGNAVLLAVFSAVVALVFWKSVRGFRR
jgi:hypothetical protein